MGSATLIPNLKLIVADPINLRRMKYIESGADSIYHRITINHTLTIIL